MRNPCGTHTFHFEFLHQYSVHWHFWHVQEACQCSSGQISIVFNDGSNSVGVDFSHRSSRSTTLRCIVNRLATNFEFFTPLFNAQITEDICLLKLSLVTQRLFRYFFKPSAKLNAKVQLCFWIHFLATWTTLHLACAVSLLCKNHTIRRMIFILTLNDTENILLSENIVVVHV